MLEDLYECLSRDALSSFAMFPTHLWDSARHDSQKNARGFVAMKVANLMTRLAIAYIDEVQGLEHADAWFQISSAGREAESHLRPEIVRLNQARRAPNFSASDVPH